MIAQWRLKKALKKCNWFKLRQKLNSFVENKLDRLIKNQKARNFSVRSILMPFLTVTFAPSKNTSDFLKKFFSQKYSKIGKAV